jgi:hypothetical protein
MFSDKTKKKILQGFLETIEWISDKEYQKRAWIRGEPPGTDFDETVNYFFLEGDELLEKYKEFKITDQQYQVLKKLRDQFYDFSEENNWPAEFIETSEWGQIIKLAKDVLKAFNYPVSESEILRKKGKPLEDGRKNHFGSQMR